MNKPAKIIRIGNSAGVILSKETLSRLGVAVGDELSLVDTPNGVELRTGNEEFEAQMAVARAVMERRRRALRELAK